MEPYFYGPDWRNEWRKVEKLYRRFPTVVLRDIAIDAGGVAMQKVLPVARQKNYVFQDQTGKLRKSIRVRKRRNLGKRTGRSILSVAYIIAGGKRAPHAHLVHQGHGGPKPAGPRPFLTDAATKASSQVFQAFHYEFSRQMPPDIQREARRLLIRPYTGTWKL